MARSRDLSGRGGTGRGGDPGRGARDLTERGQDEARPADLAKDAPTKLRKLRGDEQMLLLARWAGHDDAALVGRDGARRRAHEGELRTAAKRRQPGGRPSQGVGSWVPSVAAWSILAGSRAGAGPSATWDSSRDWLKKRMGSTAAWPLRISK